MILKRLKINTHIAEPTNCYIIADEVAKEAMIIDPAAEAEKIIEMIKILNVKVKYIYLTHCHADHIGATIKVQEELGGKILIYRNGEKNLNDEKINLSGIVGTTPIILEPDSKIDDNDTLHIGNIVLKVLYTPGHTDDSTSLYCEEYKMLFSGDTMFNGTWGRTDLPTSDFNSIMNSISNKILTLPEDTIVYPGHGKSTIIKDEKPIYLELKPKFE